MCEFCSIGPTSNKDRDASNPDFAGFFSTAAIEAAVRHAQNLGFGEVGEGEDDDDDGT